MLLTAAVRKLSAHTQKKTEIMSGSVEKFFWLRRCADCGFYQELRILMNFFVEYAEKKF